MSETHDQENQSGVQKDVAEDESDEEVTNEGQNQTAKTPSTEDGVLIDPKDDAEVEEWLTDGWDSWEKGGKEFVTIRAGGDIALNNTVCEKYFPDIEGVILLYHEEKEVIGLKPVETYDDDNPKHYRISGEESKAVHARGFLKNHDLYPEQSRRYSPEWHPNVELLTIDPNADGKVISKNTDSEDN